MEICAAIAQYQPTQRVHVGCAFVVLCQHLVLGNFIM